MKTKLLAPLLTAALCLGMLAGCGDTSGSENQTQNTHETPTASVGANDEQTSSTESTGTAGTDEVIIYLTADNKLMATRGRKSAAQVVLAENMFTDSANLPEVPAYDATTDLETWNWYENRYQVCVVNGNTAYFFANIVMTLGAYPFEPTADLFAVDLDALNGALDNAATCVTLISADVNPVYVRVSPHGIVYSMYDVVAFWDGVTNSTLLDIPVNGSAGSLELFQNGDAVVIATARGNSSAYHLQLSKLDGSNTTKVLTEGTAFNGHDIGADFDSNVVVFAYQGDSESDNLVPYIGGFDMESTPLQIERSEGWLQVGDIHNNEFYYTFGFSGYAGYSELWFYNGSDSVKIASDIDNSACYSNAEQRFAYYCKDDGMYYYASADFAETPLGVSSNADYADEQQVESFFVACPRGGSVSAWEYILCTVESGVVTDASVVTTTKGNSIPYACKGMDAVLLATIDFSMETGYVYSGDFALLTPEGETALPRIGSMAIFSLYQDKSFVGHADGELVVLQNGNESRYNANGEIGYYLRLADGQILCIDGNSLVLFGGNNISLAEDILWMTTATATYSVCEYNKMLSAK